jgi:putative aldouronate transport system substrate-binding protein
MQILPPSLNEYQTKWYVNPNINGIKGQFYLTKNCKEPEYLMAWLDQLYTLENSMESYNGVANVEKALSLENGAYSTRALSTEEAETVSPFFRSFFSNNMPSAYMMSDYSSGKLMMTQIEKDQTATVELYRSAGILNDKFWPRPYYANEDATRLGELRTDIFNTVNQYRANWVCGQSDIDADWEEYIRSLKSMGIEELISIMQKTYDTFQANK